MGCIREEDPKTLTEPENLESHFGRDSDGRGPLSPRGGGRGDVCKGKILKEELTRVSPCGRKGSPSN